MLLTDNIVLSAGSTMLSTEKVLFSADLILLSSYIFLISDEDMSLFVNKMLPAYSTGMFSADNNML
jgi:hypothetical protein